MAYEYDVFISYRSKSRAWLRELFLPEFQYYLEEEVGNNLRIFVDWHDVETGDAWELRLKRGLLKSKCLISLLMPSYFESDWCTREFAVFEHRSIRHGLLSLEQPNGLIVPISLHGSMTRPFPTSITDKQILDYQKYYYPNYEGFRKRKKYQLFTDDLKQLVKKVARVIQYAPDWNPDWQNDDWFEIPTDYLRVDNFIVSQPKI